MGSWAVLLAFPPAVTLSGEYADAGPAMPPPVEQVPTWTCQGLTAPAAASRMLMVAVEPPGAGATVADPLTFVPFIDWSDACQVAPAGVLADVVPGGGGVTDVPVVGVALLVAQAARATLAEMASSIRMMKLLLFWGGRLDDGRDERP